MEELFALAGVIEALAVRGLRKVEAARREELARRLEGIERAFHPEARRRVPEYDPCSSCTRRFTARGWKRPQARRRARCCARSSRGWMRYEWFYAPMAGPDFTPTRRKHAATVDAVRHFAGGAVAACALRWARLAHGAQLASGRTAIDGDDVVGVVTGASGACSRPRPPPIWEPTRIGDVSQFHVNRKPSRSRGLTIGCRRCGALHAFGRRTSLRGGPHP